MLAQNGNMRQRGKTRLAKLRGMQEEEGRSSEYRVETQDWVDCAVRHQRACAIPLASDPLGGTVLAAAAGG
jgi:hypothetical protein